LSLTLSLAAFAAAAQSQQLEQSPPTPAVVQAPAAPLPDTPAPPPLAEPAPADQASADTGNEIVVQARGKPPPGDPLQALNAQSFEAVQAVDSVLVAPVSKGYEKAVPKPVRKGLHNVLQNLTEPIVFVNYLLQLKPGKAVETLGRFTVNSTLGVAGLFDVAKSKPFNLPYRVNGFGYTMAYYGVKPGPFLFLPLIGPTTLRDVTGRILDLSLVPMAVGKPFNRPEYSLATGTLKSIDERLEMDDVLMTIREECPDPYVADRAWYLAKRHAEVEALHGRTVDLMANLPPCLADGLRARAAARAAAEASQGQTATPVAPAADQGPVPAPHTAPEAPEQPEPAPTPSAQNSDQSAVTATM